MMDKFMLLLQFHVSYTFTYICKKNGLQYRLMSPFYTVS
jgi:hypothetical protein